MMLSWRLKTASVMRHWKTSSGMTLRCFSSVDPDLQGQFKGKLNEAKQLPPLQDNQLKLKMYALFKQATDGQNTTARPGMMDFVAKYKWEAWAELGSMTQNEAMKSYIDMIDQMLSTQTTTESIDTVTEKDDVQISFADDGVLKIHLNRPSKFNALNWDMYLKITAALNEYQCNPKCRAAYVTSEGRMFCSGNDLSMFSNLPTDRSPEAFAQEAAVLLEKFVNAFLEFPLPIVMAVHAPAIGIAVTLLPLADLVYAHPRATFHAPFTALGQTPEACSSSTFPERMGSAKANAMLLLGKKLTAAEAEASGLVSECITGLDFHQEVDARVQALVTRPPEAVKLSKALMFPKTKIELLKRINAQECQVLAKRWISPECFDAVMKFTNKPKH